MFKINTGINHDSLALKLMSKERNENSDTEQLLKEFFYFFKFVDLQNINRDLFLPEDSTGNKMLASPNVAASNQEEGVKKK